MAKRCDLTGKQAQIGNKVSHSNNKTKKKFGVNIRKIRVKLEDGSSMRIKVAASTLRTMRKASK
ncbi:MAG: 50S ribosomal protein L28 [Helicobacteraceae bacterium]